MIGSTTEKIRTYFSSEILRVPNQSHFREAKKGVTKWVCVTKWRLYSTPGFSVKVSDVAGLN